jgi:hypothetical protein
MNLALVHFIHKRRNTCNPTQDTYSLPARKIPILHLTQKRSHSFLLLTSPASIKLIVSCSTFNRTKQQRDGGYGLQ